MINDFDDFCLRMYAIVDEIFQEIAPAFSRPGQSPSAVTVN
jgi:hypothetical protein